jgi:hypothetical protein
MSKVDQRLPELPPLRPIGIGRPTETRLGGTHDRKEARRGHVGQSGTQDETPRPS